MGFHANGFPPSRLDEGARDRPIVGSSGRDPVDRPAIATGGIYQQPAWGLQPALGSANGGAATGGEQLIGSAGNTQGMMRSSGVAAAVPSVVRDGYERPTPAGSWGGPPAGPATIAAAASGQLHPPIGSWPQTGQQGGMVQTGANQFHHQSVQPQFSEQQRTSQPGHQMTSEQYRFGGDTAAGVGSHQQQFAGRFTEETGRFARPPDPINR